MITVHNEKELLPIVRNPLADWSKTENILLPLFNKFIQEKANFDVYNGWAFRMKFIKNTNIEYQHTVASIDMSRSINRHGWVFAASKFDCNESIWVFNNTAIVIHLE